MGRQFIDTYSDDMLYLVDARNLLLQNGRFEYLVTPAFCRMFIVNMVGAVEASLNSWKKEDGTDILSSYFTSRNNQEKVDNLYNAFISAGIPVEKEVFDDYLAIHYLRHKIVHSKEKDTERRDDWIKSRGFPIDTREFTVDDWDRIQKLNDILISYLGYAYVLDPNR
ncbi:hypothetical protein JOC77_002981 [Peribacillus deserti]|uniref:Apea-like HEPN domain-containing protein n=1 Tax=Peribacillus deserti TaxID=673318 RepID=A0ABS2QK35_9BACI|nr:hypothetical protein [Peribacillus deserti]MBM7693541.1 hypothetical protein [Peribacillus deserti]